jgi:hypothetical protein
MQQIFTFRKIDNEILPATKKRNILSIIEIQSSLPMWSPLLSSHLYLKVTFYWTVIENSIWIDLI